MTASKHTQYIALTKGAVKTIVTICIGHPLTNRKADLSVSPLLPTFRFGRPIPPKMAASKQ